MFIQTEATPNPRTMKFIPGEPVMGQGSASFADQKSAEKSPLAGALFKIENVEGVFYGSDFITVTKTESSDWAHLKPYILTTIMEHYVASRPLFNEAKAEIKKTNIDDSIVNQIVELIETRVRPAVAEDGGDIIFNRFEDGVVYLELHGSCSGCPSSTATLKGGVENMLKHYIPEVVAVEAI
jgi:Fe-S cluster biogenesis protein NfuA